MSVGWRRTSRGLGDWRFWLAWIAWAAGCDDEFGPCGCGCEDRP